VSSGCFFADEFVAEEFVADELVADDVVVQKFTAHPLRGGRGAAVFATITQLNRLPQGYPPSETRQGKAPLVSQRAWQLPSTPPRGSLGAGGLCP